VPYPESNSKHLLLVLRLNSKLLPQAFCEVQKAPKSTTAGAAPGTLLGSLERSPDPIAGGEGASCPPPQEPYPRLGPSASLLVPPILNTDRRHRFWVEKKEIWHNFLLKMYLLASWRRLLSS